ncbi:hypothetical protein Tco_1456975 [Tanacetum coccineum]
MQNSPAYKTYLAYATGAATPKKARKFKKPASPSKKRTLVTVEEEEPEPAKKVALTKKSSRKQSTVKKVLKRIQRETTIHQAGGSGDGAGFQLEVLDEPKGKPVDTHEGTGLKPGVPNVSKAYSSINDDEEESDNEFVHTPEDYVPTDDEANDETKDVEQTQEQTTGVQEESGPEMASIQGQYVEQATTTTTPAIQNANTEVPPLSSSHSVSSTYTNAFLNLENLHSTETEVVSMMDINVQHKVLRTSPLLTIPVSVIPKHTVVNRYKTVTTTPSTTITSLLSSLFPYLQQSIPIPTPTNIEATTSTILVPESETLSTLHQRITDLEKDVKELKNVDNSTTVISTIKSEVPNAVKEYLESSMDDALYKQYAPQKSIEDIQKIKIEHAKKQQVPKETITSSDTTALEEIDQKTTLFNTMTKSKSFNKSLKHKALHHALMESILEDEYAMDKGVADELKKRKPDDADKDEGPTAVTDRGLKRQRTSKGTETSKKTSTSKDSSKGKSLTTSSKSGKSIKDQVEELIFVQDTDYAKHDDAKFDNTDMPMDQREDLGKTDEQPNDEAVPIMTGTRSLKVTLLLILNGTKNNHEVDFLFNNDMEYLTRGSNDKKYTASTTMSKAARYELKGIKDMVPNLWSPIKMFMRPMRIFKLFNVKVNEWYEYGYLEELLLKEQIKNVHFQGSGYLEEIVVKRADQKLYTFKEGHFKRLHLNDIEDMILLVVQNKLHNLDTNVVVHLAVNLRMFARRMVIQARVDDLQLGVKSYQKKLNLTKPRTQDVDMSRRLAYTTLSNPQGVIYEDKLKRKRFMRAAELYKFSDSTLISVRNTLDQMLHELHLGYNTTMKRRLWTILDQQRTRIMIKTIN